MQDAISGPGEKAVAAEITCERFCDDRWIRTSVHVPSEMELTIYVNRQELVTILCTPTNLNYLVLGFLYGEGIISGIEDVLMMRMCPEESLADVRLSNAAYELPTQRTITSGCGGGVVFKNAGTKVDSGLVAKPTEVLSLMNGLQEQMDLYRLSGGVHTSALSDTRNLLIVAEDIGRHNTLDKIQGECLIRMLPTEDRLLLTTGRVSSEMLVKAAKMRTPIVVSRHSTTENAVALADNLGIALVGYARGGRLVVYSHPERLGCPSA